MKVQFFLNSCEQLDTSDIADISVVSLDTLEGEYVILQAVVKEPSCIRKTTPGGLIATPQTLIVKGDVYHVTHWNRSLLK